MRKIFAASILAGAMTALSPAEAIAQSTPSTTQADAGGLQDIVVTARRREESLMSVPVAVSALSGDQLDKYNIDNVFKIAEQVPFVNVASTGTGTVFAVRGVGASTTVDSTVPQSVLLSVDDVQLAHSALSSLAFFDMAQLQVLKGPQALFFGKSSSAGVLVFNSRGPSDHLEVSGRVSYEFVADEKIVEAAISGPVTDTFGARLALRFRDMIGYTTNLSPALTDPVLGVAIPSNEGREPTQREYSGRLTLVWNPTSEFNAQFKLLGSRLHTDNEGFGETTVFCPTGQLGQQFGAAFIPDPVQICSFGRRHVNARFPDVAVAGLGLKSGKLFSLQKSLLASLRLAYDAGPVSLTSITAYTRFSKRGLTNFAGSSYYPSVSSRPFEDFKAFQQEFRVLTDLDGPLNFSLGAYYEHTRSVLGADMFIAPLTPDPVTGLWASATRAPINSGDTLSVFGQARYQITPELELAGGVRYSHDKRSVRNLGYSYLHQAFVGAFLPQGTFLSDSMSDDNLNPEVTLSYKPQPGMLLYAAYKTGYKSGGFGAPAVIINLPGVSADDFGYQSEKTKGGEIGFKTELAGRTLQLQITAFTYKFNNLQTVGYNPALFGFVYSNAAGARTRGIEAEFTWRPIPELTLRGAGGYVESRYTTFPNAACYGGQTVAQGCVAGFQDLSGRRLPYASDWSGNAGFEFDQPLGSYHLLFYGDVNYQSKATLNQILIPGATIGGYARVNAGVRFGPTEGPWEVALFSRNLTNRLKPRIIDEMSNAPIGSLYTNAISRPREIWIEASFKL